MEDELLPRRKAKAKSYLDEYLADPANRKIYEEEKEKLAEEMKEVDKPHKFVPIGTGQYHSQLCSVCFDLKSYYLHV